MTVSVSPELSEVLSTQCCGILNFPDVVPSDVVPSDVVPSDVVPSDVVPSDVVPSLEGSTFETVRS
jgi:hypothetical protein